MKQECEEQNLQVDIVLPWVDGSDPEWQKCKRVYLKESESSDSRDERYRDWEILKYVFRGIEKNLPWIRKVHFITCGHLPKWLNTECPKLNIVNHEDYIPKEFLPTFSSHPIELNIHRIEGLTEHFIYINDDCFFMKPMKKSEFFQNGLPCTQLGFNFRDEEDSVFSGILYEDRKVVNRHFFSRTVIMKQFHKFVSLKYSFMENMKTIQLLPFCIGYFPPFIYSHGPNAYLKSTFEEVWKKEPQKLTEVCSHKFRQYDDVNQYLMLWWQWCEGKCVPSHMRAKLKSTRVDRDDELLRKNIAGGLYPMVCINDTSLSDDKFKYKKNLIINLLDEKLPDKSSFEVD